MNLTKSFWEKSESSEVDSMGRKAYSMAVSLFTIYGLLVASFLAKLTLTWTLTFWEFLGVGFLIPVIGIFIAADSDDLLKSLIGYNLLVIGMGLVLGPAVNQYDAVIVIRALVATLGVSIVMTIVGMVLPEGATGGWGSYLFGALLALIFVRIVQMFMMASGFPSSAWYWPFVEYAGVVLFSLLLIRDWNRAKSLPANLPNAVGVAMAVFLDVLNLFMFFLRIFGMNSSSD